MNRKQRVTRKRIYEQDGAALCRGRKPIIAQRNGSPDSEHGAGDEDEENTQRSGHEEGNQSCCRGALVKKLPHVRLANR